MALAFLIAGILSGLFFAFLGIKNLLVFKTIQNLPTRLLKESEEGIFEAQGKVRGETPIFSPIHRRECVYYALTLEEKREKTFKQTARIELFNPFDIQDSSGKARINPEKAVFKLRIDEQYSSSHFGAQLPETLQSFLS